MITYDASRGFDRSIVFTKVRGDYIRKRESVLIIVSSGCGKSFIISALGHQTCAQGYSVGHYNIQKLLFKAVISRTESTIVRFLEKIAYIG